MTLCYKVFRVVPAGLQSFSTVYPLTYTPRARTTAPPHTAIFAFRDHASASALLDWGGRPYHYQLWRCNGTAPRKLPTAIWKIPFVDTAQHLTAFWRRRAAHIYLYPWPPGTVCYKHLTPLERVQ